MPRYLKTFSLLNTSHANFKLWSSGFAELEYKVTVPEVIINPV